MSKILIVGLGNPGTKYDDTPHNVGFVVIDIFIASENEINKKYAHVYETALKNTSVVFAKPKTFMNESGGAVKTLAKSYQLTANNLWLVHDDVDLPLGTVRVQYNRGSAGHRGVQNVIDTLGSQKFYRFRVGVRPLRVPRARSREWMNTFVTKPIRGLRKKQLHESAQLCADIIERALENKDIKSVLGDHKRE